MMNEEVCTAIKELGLKVYKGEEEVELDQWYEISYQFKVTPDGVLCTPVQIFKKKSMPDTYTPHMFEEPK